MCLRDRTSIWSSSLGSKLVALLRVSEYRGSFPRGRGSTAQASTRDDLRVPTVSVDEDDCLYPTRGVGHPNSNIRVKCQFDWLAIHHDASARGLCLPSSLCLAALGSNDDDGWQSLWPHLSSCESQPQVSRVFCVLGPTARLCCLYAAVVM